MKRHKIVGITGVDTRALTRHIRLKGAMKGGISTTDLDKEVFLKKVQASPSIVGSDLIPQVTCKEIYHGFRRQIKYPAAFSQPRLLRDSGPFYYQGRGDFADET